MASSNALPEHCSSHQPLPKVYLHTSPRETLLPHLLPLLPYTIPIVRRIQFHLQTPYAQVLSTLSLSSQPPNRQNLQAPSSSIDETSIPPLSSSYTESFNRISSDAHRQDKIESSVPPLGKTARSANPSLSTAETAIPPFPANYSEGPQNEQQSAPSTFLPIVPRPVTHFAAAYIDRSRCPETEAWTFSTLELPPSSSPQEPPDASVKFQIPALYIHHLSTLTSQFQSTVRQVSGIDSSRSLTEILIGATNRTTLSILHSGPICNENGAYGQLASSNVRKSAAGKVVRSHTPANTKFLFSPDDLGRGNTELPEGLEWAGLGQGKQLDEEEIKLALSLTEIPRRAATMQLLPSLGIRTSEGTLIAWAFLGPDASLTTLHVQPPHRKQGLAQKLTRKLFAQVRNFANPMLSVTSGTKLKLQQKAYEDIAEGEEWNHADVLFQNAASAGAMKAVGGQAAWDDFWAILDLERLGELVEEMRS